MATVVITISDVDGSGLVHGKIRKIKDEHEVGRMTMAEKIGHLMFQSFEESTITGLDDAGIAVTQTQIQ